MTGELEGVRALVTGASRGVGRAVAEAYASRRRLEAFPLATRCVKCKEKFEEQQGWI